MQEVAVKKQRPEKQRLHLFTMCLDVCTQVVESILNRVVGCEKRFSPKSPLPGELLRATENVTR